MKRLAMRKIKEVVRLGAQGLSPRRIGESLGIGRTTVQECLGRARAAGLSWPLPEELSDADLEQRLYPRATGAIRGSFPQRITIPPLFPPVPISPKTKPRSKARF